MNTRVRFRFSKLGKVRFTSHRDVARLWERAVRRAGLPVAMTEGFNPRVKVHFGLALPTGYESLGEYVDVDFRADELAAVDLSSLPARLTPLLPEGLTVESAAAVDPASPSLQQAVTSCTWRIEAVGLSPSEATAAIDRLLAADTVMVTRQRKGHDVTDDIRPHIHTVAVLGPLPGHRPAGSSLEAELGTQPRGLRPSELLAALAGDGRRLALTGDDLLQAVASGEPILEEGLVCRTHQWVDGEGARCEPLAAPPSATHAEQRAS
jgi:radical SAM-linked protein